MSYNVSDQRIDAYLAAVDDALDTADLYELIDILIETAARRGFRVRADERTLVIENDMTSSSSMTLIYTGRPVVTPEAVADMIAFFANTETPEELMNIYSTDLFKYLAGDMIGQNTVTLTIAAVSLEKMNSGKGGEQVKPCLHFQERDKMMVLNKTNAALIAKELGGETDRWAGARVTLNAPMIEAFGRQSRSIRVIRVDPPDVPNKSRSGNSTPADGGNGNS